MKTCITGNIHQLLTSTAMSGYKHKTKKEKENGKTKICMVATWLGFQAVGLSQHIRMQIFRF